MYHRHFDFAIFNLWSRSNGLCVVYTPPSKKAGPFCFAHIGRLDRSVSSLFCNPKIDNALKKTNVQMIPTAREVSGSSSRSLSSYF